MCSLDNPVLLAQCARIKAMAEQTAQDPKYQNRYYARTWHHWQLSPAVKPSEIKKFEKLARFELPIEYVYFLTQVGSGGACPGTNLQKFNPEWGKLEQLQNVSAQFYDAENVYLSEEDWEEKYGTSQRDFYDGTLSLCGMDITYDAQLIVAGPLRGRIVYLDYNCEAPPMWPKSSPDFLTWYENFFSELLAGYDIDPTWKFMWQEPGDSEALMKAYQNAPDETYRQEVLGSFCKFPKLDEKARQFLCGLDSKTAGEILAYFKDNKDNKDKR